jgi:hypothetical protein
VGLALQEYPGIRTHYVRCDGNDTRFREGWGFEDFMSYIAVGD